MASKITRWLNYKGETATVEVIIGGIRLVKILWVQFPILEALLCIPIHRLKYASGMIAYKIEQRV